MNLLRRHLEPLRWGIAFDKLLRVRGVKRGHGENQGEHCATVEQCAGEVGVTRSTANKRLKLADDYATLQADEQKLVDAGKSLQWPPRAPRPPVPDSEPGLIGSRTAMNRSECIFSFWPSKRNIASNT